MHHIVFEFWKFRPTKFKCMNSIDLIIFVKQQLFKVFLTRKYDILSLKFLWIVLVSQIEVPLVTGL